MKQRLERALRAIDSLPEDDWQPEHWDVFTVARRVIADEVDGQAAGDPVSAPRSSQGAPLQLVWRWCAHWDRQFNKGAGKPRPRPEDGDR